VTTDPSGGLTTSGIVLAGGASRRFGSDKLEVRIEGVRLLDLALGSLIDLVGEIVVVVAPGRPAPALSAVVGNTPVRLAVDPEPFGGPLAGIRTGLAAAHGGRVIVVGGDMPSIIPGVLRLLLDRPPAALADEVDALRPLPCVLDRIPALSAAERLLGSGERRLRALLVELGTVAIPWAEWSVEDPAGLSLHDIDEPADVPGSSRAPTLRSGPWGEEEPGP
jgi:molybdenum cofactor guanylyltransferase